MGSTTEFLTSLQSGLNACGLTAGKLIVAVSGGPDSMALLRGLLELAEFRPHLCVAHLNHGLRGQGSDDDADWIARFCGELDLACRIERQDVLQYQQDRGLSLEEAARDVRYEFLQRIAHEERAAHITLAHTLDDQVETILHHILRGTGLAGIRGIPQVRQLADGIRLARPLLQTSRQQVEAYLRAIGQDVRIDPTNSDSAWTRNRLRHELLPQLARDYNPQVETALLHLSHQAGEIQQEIERQAREWLDRALIDQGPAYCRVLCSRLPEALALRREVFVQLWRRLGWPRQQMGFDEWDKLARLVDETAAAIHLPHQVAARRRDDLLVLNLLSQ